MFIAKKSKTMPCAFVAVLLIASVTAGCTFTGTISGEGQSLPPNTVSEDITPDNNDQEAQDTMENIPGVLLSEEELAQFNEIFAAHLDAEYCLPVNGFFTSLYDDVTEIDFVEFLRYYPGDGILEEEDAAEFEALSGHPDFPWKAEHFEKETLTVNDLPVPTRRILRSSVDETLQKYAGITTSDLKNIEGVLYLSEYDAYYNFTSDFGPGVFRCVGGKKDGNIIRLWSDSHGFDGSREILTLQEIDRNFYIKSLQNTNEKSKFERGCFG